MSLLLYDKAIFKKLVGVYDEVIFGSPDEAFRINASKNDGRVLMPFISVWRLNDFSINRVVYNDKRVRDGARIRMGNDLNSPIRFSRGIPVMLTYQIDVYSNKRITCDGIASELVLALSENPYVDVIVEGVDGRSFTQQFGIVISDSIVDNTSISDFEDTNRIYRLTVEVVINEAIIYRIDKYNSKLVEKVLVDIGMEDLGSEKILETYNSMGFNDIDENGDDVE
jgi:hypothetical protein